MNPYKTIEGLYDHPDQYFNLSNTSNSSEEALYHESLLGLPPHIYLIANRTLRSLVAPSLENNTVPLSQSVIISGESGSGIVSIFIDIV